MRVEPELKAQYVASGQVKLAFHPIVDLGPGSLSSQIAARCAGEQAPLNFWRMHDLLFENQSTIYGAPANDYYVELATGLGMDGAALAACMENPATAATVTRLDQVRRDAGIRNRPSFDINGQIVAGGLPLAQFQQVIEGKLGN
jgi:protein-disulfide isomerase